jgi:hypothetical protein
MKTDKSAERLIYEEIKAYYLRQGRTAEQWQEVTQDPVKFNLVWRRALGLRGEGLPPPELRKINPATGEILK